MKKLKLKNIIRESIKGLMTEQERRGTNSVSGYGVFSTKTNSIIPFNQEIIDALNSQGADTSFWKGSDSIKQPDSPLDVTTADKVDPNIDTDVDVSDRLKELAGIKPLYTLEEQSTQLYYWVSCKCGIQGFWIPSMNMAYCPAVTSGGVSTSTYWFAWNNTVNGQAPSGGDIWHYDHTALLGPNYLSNYPAGHFTIEVIPGSIMPTSGPNNNILSGLDFNPCTCGSSCPISPSGCDPNGPFPGSFNLQSWTNTWTSLPNFSSSNPNQPCNFVCQRRNQWTSQLATGGMGPAQTNMVECKLAEAENQYQIHNCANSNANNCP